MTRQLKFVRDLIARSDIKFVALPILLAIITPNIFESIWILRLLAVFLTGLTIVALSIYGLIFPDQILQQEYKLLTGRRKYLFWLLFAIIFVALPLSFYIFLIPSSADLYRVITDPRQATVSRTLQFSRTEYSGGAAPWFMYQRLYSTEGTEYTLYFDLRPLGPGAYDVTYSPYTNMVFGISSHN